MAGYDGHSMSNNARDAYAQGKMPASKLAKKLGVATPTIRHFFDACEWHHTSKKYNQTDFYRAEYLGDLSATSRVDFSVWERWGIDPDDEPLDTELLIVWMKAWQKSQR